MYQKLFWKALTAASIFLIFSLSYNVILRFLDVIIMAILSAYLVYPLTWRLSCWGARQKKPWSKVSNHHLFAPTVSFLLIVVPFVMLLLKAVGLLTDPRSTQLYLDFLYKSPEVAARTKEILDMIGFRAFSEVIAGRVRELSFTLGATMSKQITQVASRVLIDIPIYLISTFYFIEGGQRMITRMKGYIPKSQRFMRSLIKQADEIAHALFIGHFLTSMIVGAMAAVGFWILSAMGVLPLVNFAYALFLGLITGIAVLLPVIGSWFVYIPITVWILNTQTMAVAIPNAFKFFIFCMVFLTFIPNFFIRPKLVSQESDVHPLIVILGFIGGPLIWGLKGFVMGPLALGLAQAAIQTYFETIEKNR